MLTNCLRVRLGHYDCVLQIENQPNPPLVAEGRHCPGQLCEEMRHLTQPKRDGFKLEQFAPGLESEKSPEMRIDFHMKACIQ